MCRTKTLRSTTRSWRLQALIALVAGVCLVAQPVVAGSHGESMSAAARAKAQMASPGEMVDVLLMHKHSERANLTGRVRGLGGEVIREFESIAAVAARLPAGALEKLADHPALSFMALDAPVAAFADASINDPRSTVDMSQAGAYGLDGTGVTVAVLDSGIDSHPDLSLIQSVDILPAYSSCGFRSDRIEHGLNTLFRFEDGD
ncbi:MAG: hypothetical protein OEV00_02825 [Acidobacteriota bacterium]|nr:hypothetical protein [Acidobacteriota bacterium]MDH3784244.1 hypothetical protein [Acidobacteriota bacterium]